MVRYLLRRLFWLIPTWWVITVLTFFLTTFAPGDPVDHFAGTCGTLDPGRDYAEWVACRAKIRQKLGLDLPVFYVEISTLATPKDFYRQPDYLQDSLQRLLYQYGNWPAVQAYRQAVAALIRAVEQADDVTLRRLDQARSLDRLADPAAIVAQLDALQQPGERAGELPWLSSLQQARTRLAALSEQATRWRHFVPVIYWHGWHNQYHRWFTRLLRGHFGQSYASNVSVKETLRRHLPWTFTFALLGTLLVFTTGIPLGVMSAMYPGSFWDRGGATISIMLQVIPTFWVGTLLFTYFADPEQVSYTIHSGFKPYLHDWLTGVSQMPLPLVAFVYGSFQLSQLMRSTLKEQMAAPYLRTARAKGLSHAQAVWRHAFRNASLSLITVATGVLPTLLVGSIVIEAVFKIEAMGQVTLQAVLSNDIPLVMAVFTLVALLTLIGYFLADVLYAWLDPRVAHSMGRRGQ
jgi:peptide/nickel transport system permease protein